VNAFADFARGWLDWTIAASWQLALLVCLIAALTFVLRDASPRLRYGLWLLVLIKALLPPTLAASWAVGAWGVVPVVEHDWSVANWPGAGGLVPDSAPIDAATSSGADARAPMNARGAASIPADRLLLLVWSAGCLSLWGTVVWRYRRLLRKTDAMRRIDEGPLRVELERLAARFSIRTVPDLFAAEQTASPMLFGVLHPKIVLPESVLERLSPQELRMIVAHELVHWRRCDTWVGWLQVLVQGVFWFHPLVWLANARIRHERECACDETVLREANCQRDGYGETIVRVLTAARGRSLVMANMVGIFERGSRVQTRLEEIMNFDPMKRRFGWLSRGALVAAAVVLLPMAAPGVQADRAEKGAAETAAQKTERAARHGAAAKRPKTNWPTIVSTQPRIGATDVDPSIKEISVTFDRDMDVGGYSWTGAGPFHPPSPPDAGPVWIDKRTCVLPVQLEGESFYRVGINSTSYQNFRSAMGVPAETTAIYFATKGAKASVASRARAPKIVAMAPENGAKDVDAGLKAIRVTFNIPMDTGGFSWTGGGPTFPTIPEGKKPRWARDGKSCTLPVELKPGAKYELGLNSFSHKNFASKWGVPLEPVRYEFRTAGDPASAEEEDATVAKPGEPPRIVRMIPDNGAQDVDPSLKRIRVTFDRPMAAGFSWTGGGEHFPTIPDGAKPKWSADRKTCTLPVALRPDWDYRLGLNSPSFKNFASAEGSPLEPVVYGFRTSPGNE
jgi:beta-lactamase regulating signal transducer with metallopeptidase domain